MIQEKMLIKNMEGMRLEKLVGKQTSGEGDWEEKTASRQGTKKQQGVGGPTWLWTSLLPETFVTFWGP